MRRLVCQNAAEAGVVVSSARAGKAITPAVGQKEDYRMGVIPRSAAIDAIGMPAAIDARSGKGPRHRVIVGLGEARLAPACAGTLAPCLLPEPEHSITHRIRRGGNKSLKIKDPLVPNAEANRQSQHRRENPSQAARPALGQRWIRCFGPLLFSPFWCRLRHHRQTGLGPETAESPHPRPT